MDTNTDWTYGVFEPHGSEGWRPYGSDPGRWQGAITVPDTAEGAKHAIGLIVSDLMTEWERASLSRAMHARVFLWHDEAGELKDADFVVEVRPRSGFDAA
ncbi:hypothetical protein JK359_35940 [Streptomyces actinomycinicus]|uniref:Uncharacterized protein n=1 Tax=Streptomyces actinomycinicus TaxID=1695166 RepID=A0A937ESM7_9ACTN|nr:hypothetical protein [Streptomyces actinomycinicus]MBL1087289.1 hypothetical protein [Streptomyces actinomycinicus]